MPLGMELGLGPSNFVLDGDPAALPKKGAGPQIFSPCLLGPNSWMDQDGTWHGGRPQHRRLCVRWGPSPPHKFSAHVYYGHPVEYGRPLYFHPVVSLFLSIFFFFSSPNLSSRTFDVYHISTHGVALVRI